MGNFFAKKKGSSTTAEEVAAGVDARSLTAIVTGGNTGIGAETVRVMAKQGARVVIAARNLQSAEKTRDSILEELPGAKILCMRLDLASLASVRGFAQQFLAENLPLNILINNAGVMFVPYSLSPDGIEMHYTSNHIGHFLLTNLLLEKMRATAEESQIQGRIVILSSVAHTNLLYPKKPVLDEAEINDEKLYDSNRAYGHSKLCNVLHAKELAERVRAAGMNVTVNAVHPGIIRTGLWKNSLFMRLVVGLIYFGRWKTVEEGAATTVAAALREDFNEVSGQYLEDCHVSEASKVGCDMGLAKKAWEISERVLAAAEKKAGGGGDEGEGEGEGL